MELTLGNDPKITIIICKKWAQLMKKRRKDSYTKKNLWHVLTRWRYWTTYRFARSLFILKKHYWFIQQVRNMKTKIISKSLKLTLLSHQKTPTLIATSLWSFNIPWCTWAIEAAAIGCSSSDRNLKCTF